jgi:ABC-2 type transport system ATP-binding protein
VVRLAGVRKRYRGGREVLAGIDLDVAPGRPVVVIGGNGTGKSTLLRIAAGCSAPTQGSVSGRPPVVGFLPAHFPASSRMPVRAYLRHMAAMHGAPAATSIELLDALGFSGAVDGPVAQLSTGNVQKVGIAQALGCGAGLLVLDEPWPGLDARAATALDELLVDEIGRGTAVLIADHTGRAAELPGSTVLQMANGRLGPAAVEARRVAHTVVELRCPGAPAAALRALPPVRESWTSADSLTVRVPVDRGDTLLAAALAAGCSVLDVRREGHR